ncbi:hypothetical protein [Neisseria sp. Ec49-e6-T10]|uniref:hypothetical protein n=1 Tax=Neisseria sp. Ec49-e6-T10 TaxID=3140744 RepID=UPI003EBA28E5
MAHNKKLIISVQSYLNKQPTLHLSYLNEQDVNNTLAVNHTLIRFITQQLPEYDQDFERLLQLTESKQYVPEHPHIPTWGLNGTYVWLQQPQALFGHIGIENEHTQYCQNKEKGIQQFTFEQYRTTLNFWRTHEEMVQSQNLSTLSNLTKEIIFPK